MKKLIFLLIILAGCATYLTEEEIASINAIEAVKNFQLDDGQGNTFTLESYMESLIEGKYDGNQFSPNGKLSLGNWNTTVCNAHCQGLDNEYCCVVVYHFDGFQGSWFVGRDSLKVLGSDHYTESELCMNQC